jgi:hypothetical protein
MLREFTDFCVAKSGQAETESSDQKQEQEETKPTQE